MVDERCGHRYLDTSHYPSCNSGGCGRSSLDNGYFSYSNPVGYHSSDVGRDVYRSMQYSSHNRVTHIYVEKRGGYRSHPSHYSSHNTGDSGRLLTLPIYFKPVEENIHKKDKADISHDDDDGRRYRSSDESN